MPSRRRLAVLMCTVTGALAKPKTTVIKLNETCDTFDVTIERAREKE